MTTRDRKSAATQTEGGQSYHRASDGDTESHAPSLPDRTELYQRRLLAGSRPDGSATTVAVHIQLEGKWFVDSTGTERHLTPFCVRLRSGDDVALIFSCREALPVMRNVLAGTDTNWLGRYEIVGSRVHSLETMTDHLVSTIPSEQDDVDRLATASGAVDDRHTALDTFHRDRGRISGNRAILLVVDESSPFYSPVNHLWEPLLRLEREKGRLVLRLRAEELSAGSGEISCALEVLNGNSRL